VNATAKTHVHLEQCKNTYVLTTFIGA